MNETSMHYLTATGAVATRDLYLGLVSLTAGDAAAGTLTLRDGGAGGAVVLVLKAPTGTVASVNMGSCRIVAPHVTLAGAGAVCTIEG